ncbi:MAG: hypothetical protein LBN10_00715 [Propionibacteriaceae bacterium]|jgi:alternate signal-mediated exported protein|nr:hypothetical protein [Propionibacteriaceae bacterium]
MRKKSVIICASLLAVFMAVLGGQVTFALWEADVASPLGVIATGDMKMTIGDVTWATSCASGDATTLSAVQVTPGDALHVSAQVTTQFAGDNLGVALSASFSNMTQAFDATWHVEDSSGQVAPVSGDAPLTSALTLPSDEGEHVWTVVVSVSFRGSGPAWVDPGAKTTPSLDLGVLTLRANQVRCGGGFSHECGGQ